MLEKTMMKRSIIQRHPLVMEENMSNLTSASGEACVSSNQQQASFVSPTANPNPAKKKRSLPGNPDPEAEVVALSPKSLLATNRFVCEICNKGFQRDQNLQLHRRGHNLPWKLKQRSSTLGNKEVRKKVYVCPEATCVHNDPARALGDLTGIKKHYCRKHGEKKWKCDKCSKKYAVQSDWKAHSKTCGTREYRCDCGTLFSRRDSFITHRAFCDALAEDSARVISTNPNPMPVPHHLPLLFSQPVAVSISSAAAPPLLPGLGVEIRQNKEKNRVEFFSTGSGRPELTPPWLARQGTSSSTAAGPQYQNHHMDANMTSSPFFCSASSTEHELPPPRPVFDTSAPAHMSATALLQRAAQMGATTVGTRPSPMAPTTTSGNYIGLVPSPPEIFGSGYRPPPLPSTQPQNVASTMPAPPTSVSHWSFADAFGSMLNPKGGGGGHGESGPKGSAKVDDGLTRDFLGLTAFSHDDILDMAGLEVDPAMSYRKIPQQSKQPWNG